MYGLYRDSAEQKIRALLCAGGNGASSAQPRVLASTDLRCGGVAWGTDDLAIVYEVITIIMKGFGFLGVKNPNDLAILYEVQRSALSLYFTEISRIL
jgi:hypothetical protein